MFGSISSEIVLTLDDEPTAPAIGVSGLRNLLEQRLCRSEIGRRETLGESIVNRCQQVARFFAASLLAPQPRKAHGGTQFPRQCALLACQIGGLAVVILGRRRRSGRAPGQQQFPPDPQCLGGQPPFFTTLDAGDRLLDRGQTVSDWPNMIRGR